MTEPTLSEEVQAQQILEGQALSMLRIRRRKTQGELAEWLGVQASVLSSWEKGRRRLEEGDRARLIELLGYTPEAFERALAVLQELDLLQLPAIGAETTEDELRKQRARLLVAEREAYGDFLAAREERLVLFRRIQASRENAPRLWRVLENRGPSKWRMLVRDTREYKDWALCELICHLSEKRAGSEPAEALQLAELAVWIAECVPGRKDWRDQVKGFAWAHLGNSQRAMGQLLIAAETLTRAEEFWETGTRVHPVILSHGRMLSLKASLRLDQRRLDEALSLLEQAQCEVDSLECLKIEIKAASVLEELGRFAEALTILEGATKRVEVSGNLGMVFAWRFNRASCLCQAGRLDEAASWYFEAQTLGQRLGNDLHQVRLRWLEGRLSAAAGRLDVAIQAYQDVRGDFVKRQDLYETALVSLELTAALLRQGDTRQVQKEAAELAPLFEQIGLPLETLATCHLLCQAAASETATLDMVHQVAQGLRLGHRRST